MSADLLESAAAFGQPLQDWEYPGSESWDGTGSAHGQTSRPTRIEDRSEGRFYPLYETEQDLARMRAVGRVFQAFSETARGAADALTNYVVGTGFTFTAKPVEGVQPPVGLKAAVQSLIYDLIDENDFKSGLDREIHERSREDGESLIAVYPNDAEPSVARFRLIESDQLREPANPLPIEDWLGTIDEFQSYWKFGVHTKHDRHMGCEDATQPLGYHVVFDGSGDDWDYLPADRAEHIKRNVYRTAKRGVSDWEAVYRRMSLAEKLTNNTAEGAAIQAAIAFIRQHAPGTTKAEVNALLASNATSTQRVPTSTGTKRVKVERFLPGSIPNIPDGQQYIAGPMGSLNHPIFVQVSQFLLRLCGVRWQMPEYLISGDASNGNYASTFEATSPFVKARDADQAFYGRHWVNLLWKAIKIAINAGRFTEYGIAADQSGFRQLRRLIHLDFDAPAVESRNKLEQAQLLQIELQNGVIDLEQWATETGRDPERVSTPVSAVDPRLTPAAEAMQNAETPEERVAIMSTMWEAYP